MQRDEMRQVRWPEAIPKYWMRRPQSRQHHSIAPVSFDPGLPL